MQENRLLKQAIAAKAIKEELRALGQIDPQLMEDMVEGETNFFEEITYAAKKLGELTAMEDGLQRYIDKLTLRKGFLAGQQSRIRNTMLKAMQLADEKTVRTIVATLTRSASSARVLILDEKLLPDDCVEIERKASKTKIKDKLQKGQKVPGAEMSNGGETLTVRLT